MLEWVTDIIETMGYVGIGLLMFLENVFPPIPSEIIMPFAGFAAARSEQLGFWGVVLAGTVGSVLGQLPLYYLGRLVGTERIKRWADRHGKWLTLTADSIDHANAWFSRYGAIAVFFCRMIPGVRSLISIPAGIERMNMAKFLAYSTLGMGIWSGALAYAGRLLGNNYQLVEDYVGPVGYVVFGVIGVGLIAWWFHRKRKQKKQQLDMHGPNEQPQNA